MNKVFIIVIGIAFFFIIAIPSNGFTQDKGKDKLIIKNSLFKTNYYYNGKEISKSRFLTRLCKFDESISEWEKGRNKSNIANVLGFVGGALIGYPVGRAIAGAEEPGWPLAAGGATIVIVGCLLEQSAKRHY